MLFVAWKVNMQDSLKGTLETILVVDDHDEVLKAVVAILERANFLVLSAGNGAAAIKLAEQTKGKIHLLLSDVDMPEMSGPDLGEALKKARPDLHVMLMSGGSNGNLLVLNYGWAFIQKPFVTAKLVQMITDVLHSEDRSQLGGQEFDSRKDTKNPNCAKSKETGDRRSDSIEPKVREHSDKKPAPAALLEPEC
ncbi:MAG TPA: response regulator [Bryobacteraceae bacterium]|nr:response regulator [Bryobacteraceae bacterium]